jgi:hypothetical protein
VDLLAEAVPGCVRLSGLLAALAGCLSELAHGLAAAPALAGLRRIPHRVDL